MPTSDSVIAPKSTKVPRQTAAMMPSGSAMSDGDGHRRKRQLGGRGHALENLLRHRLIVAKRHAEVAAQQALKKRRVLHEQRPIEAQTLAQLRDVFRRRALRRASPARDRLE